MPASRAPVRPRGGSTPLPQPFHPVHENPKAEVEGKEKRIDKPHPAIDIFRCEEIQEEHDMAEKRPELDPYGHELERRRALEEWEARKRAEAKHEEGQKKQAELATYLKRRGEEWMATTGEKPTLNDLATWRREYMDKVEAAYQQERQKEMQEAERLYGF